MTAVLNRQANAASTLLNRFSALDRATDSFDPSVQWERANGAMGQTADSMARIASLTGQNNSLLATMGEEFEEIEDAADNAEKAWKKVKEAWNDLASFLPVDAVKNLVDSVFELNNTQFNAEVQLATVLKNQGSGKDDFAALTERASEIQGLTMYGDEAMISGAAELSTYISDTEAISHMMGTLANYAAGMSGGGEVGTQAMTDYATQLGKALDGTYDGLKKKGFELTEEQQKIIENGTDMEKALVLDEVISQSWAGLAENMRNTPTGAITSLNNTIGDIGETIGANITPAFMALADKVEAFVNSSGFDSMLSTLTSSLVLVFDILSFGAGVIQVVADNWGLIGPALTAVVAALVIYKTVTLISAAAQWVMNGALLACPITWIVLAIIALVAILAVVIDVINSCTGSTLSLGGVLGGTIMVILAALANTVIMLWNIVIEIILGVWNYIAQFVNFFANVWTDPLGSVVRLFTGIFDTILSIVQTVADAIGGLFGQDWGSGIQSFRDQISTAVEEQYGEGAVDVTVDEKMLSLDYIDYGDAWDMGYEVGDNMFKTDDGGGFSFNPDEYGLPDTPAGTADDPIHTEVDNDINIADEDLQLMRDVAEARYVQNFVTLTPTVQVSGNTINERADVNELVSEIEYRLESEFAASAEGVYG